MPQLLCRVVRKVSMSTIHALPAMHPLRHHTVSYHRAPINASRSASSCAFFANGEVFAAPYANRLSRSESSAELSFGTLQRYHWRFSLTALEFAFPWVAKHVVRSCAPR